MSMIDYTESEFKWRTRLATVHCLKKKQLPIEPYFFDFLEHDDYIGNRSDKLLTPLKTITSTIGYTTNMKLNYADISKYAHEYEYPIRGIGSNLVDINSIVNNPFMGIDKIKHRRCKRSNKAEKLGGVKVRNQKVGNGYFYHCAIEYKVSFDNIKKYNARVSPSTGGIQIHGLNNEVFKTGNYIVDCVLLDIEKKMKLEKIKVEKINIVLFNASCGISGFDSDTEDLKIKRIAEILHQQWNNPFDPEYIQPPFDITYIVSTENFNNSVDFKFSTPTKTNTNRQTTIRIFSKGRINIIGGPDPLTITKIYTYVGKILSTFRKVIIIPKNFTKPEGPVPKWVSLFGSLATLANGV